MQWRLGLGFKIEFEASETINLTPEQELELYQIAQEILNNIIKHAQADTCESPYNR